MTSKHELCKDQRTAMGGFQFGGYPEDRIVVYTDPLDGKMYCFNGYEVLNLDLNPWNGNPFPESAIEEAKTILYDPEEPIEATPSSIEKVRKLWKKYQRPLVSRLREDVSVGEFTINEIIQSIIEADPTSTQKYAEWIIKSYLDEGIKRWEDLPRTNEALQKYRYLADRKLLEPKDKDINEICGLGGCSRKNREQRGLVEVLKGYSEHLKKFEDHQDIKLAEGEVDIIFESEEVKVIHPKTKAASCKYGKGTEWCTAATKTENMFDRYNKDGVLWIFIPKNPKYEGEKYQLFIETRHDEEIEDDHFQLMDQNDLEVPFWIFFQIFRGRFDLLHLVDKMNEIGDEYFRSELVVQLYLADRPEYIDKADSILDGNRPFGDLPQTVAKKGESTLLEKLDLSLDYKGCIRTILDRNSIGPDELRMIKYLGDNKLDVPGNFEIGMVCSFGDLTILKYFVEDLKMKVSLNCLLAAVKRTKNLKLVKYLVEEKDLPCSAEIYENAKPEIRKYLKEKCVIVGERVRQTIELVRKRDDLTTEEKESIINSIDNTPHLSVVQTYYEKYHE